MYLKNKSTLTNLKYIQKNINRIEFFKIFILFSYLAVLGRSCGLQDPSLVLLSSGMWDFSSPPMDQTHVPCIGRQILNHWTTREVPRLGF